MEKIGKIAFMNPEHVTLLFIHTFFSVNFFLLFIILESQQENDNLPLIKFNKQLRKENFANDYQFFFQQKKKIK